MQYNLISYSDKSVIQEVFSGFSEVTLPDGSTAFLESSESDERPFVVEKETHLFNDLKISVDYANFESVDDYKKFRDEIKEVGDFDEGVIGRKSIIPDPEMIKAISKFVLATTVEKKVLEKLTDTILDDTIPKAYEGIKRAVFTMAKYFIPKNRPITFVFLVSGIFNVQLVVRSNDPNKVMTAILQHNLSEVLEKAQEFHKALDINGKITTPRRTEIIVKVQDLLSNSTVKVTKICDICGKKADNPSSYGSILAIEKGRVD